MLRFLITVFLVFSFQSYQIQENSTPEDLELSLLIKQRSVLEISKWGVLNELNTKPQKSFSTLYNTWQKTLYENNDFGVWRPKIKLNVPDNVKPVKIAKKYLGVRYRWGGENPKRGIDCSAFVKIVFKKAKGVNLPRVSREQAKVGKYVPKQRIKVGDMLFFATKRNRRRITHVGIYIGDGKFIHASSAYHRVVITSFKEKPFYWKRLLFARRLV